MRAHKNSTDQECSFIVKANGLECPEYTHSPVPLASGSDILECCIPVSDGDELEILINFSGTVLNASFDIIADGSFIGDRRIESKGPFEVKHYKRKYTINKFFNMPIPDGYTSIYAPTKVVEGTLHARILPLEDATTDWKTAGGRLGAGSLAIVVSLNQRSEDQYYEQYADTRVGSWRDREAGEISLEYPGHLGIPPTHELVHRITDDGISNKRSSKHNRRYKGTRFGKRPWATFIFHYRSRAAIEAAGCVLVQDSQAFLLPESESESVSMPPKGKKQQEEPTDIPRHGQKNENTREEDTGRIPHDEQKQDHDWDADSLFMSPEPVTWEQQPREQTDLTLAYDLVGTHENAGTLNNVDRSDVVKEGSHAENYGSPEINTRISTHPGHDRLHGGTGSDHHGTNGNEQIVRTEMANFEDWLDNYLSTVQMSSNTTTEPKAIHSNGIGEKGTQQPIHGLETTRSVDTPKESVELNQESSPKTNDYFKDRITVSNAGDSCKGSMRTPSEARALGKPEWRTSLASSPAGMQVFPESTDDKHDRSHLQTPEESQVNLNSDLAIAKPGFDQELTSRKRTMSVTDLRESTPSKRARLAALSAQKVVLLAQVEGRKQEKIRAQEALQLQKQRRQAEQQRQEEQERAALAEIAQYRSMLAAEDEELAKIGAEIAEEREWLEALRREASGD